MYNGARNAIAMENFLFDLEQYLKAMGIAEDITKIRNTAIFLREAT